MSDGIIEGLDLVQSTKPTWHGKEQLCEAIVLKKGAPLMEGFKEDGEGNKTDVIVQAPAWLRQWDVEEVSLSARGNKKTPYKIVGFSDRPNDPDGTEEEPREYFLKPYNPETYHLLENERFMDLIEECLHGIEGATVTTCGSVCGRTKAFVTVSIEEIEAYKAGGREFEPFLNFLTGFTGNIPLLINNSNVCTVCDNTFRWNLQLTKQRQKALIAAGIVSEGDTSLDGLDGKAGLQTTFKHTKNMPTLLKKIPAIVQAFLKNQTLFASVLDLLGDMPCSHEEAISLFYSFISSRSVKSGELSNQTASKAMRLFELFKHGKGNSGETMADVFSAVTDYFTHENTNKLTLDGDTSAISKQYVSSEFGSAGDSKEQFFDWILLTDNHADYIKHGDKLRKEQAAKETDGEEIEREAIELVPVPAFALPAPTQESVAIVSTDKD
tara:strand:+ start:85487 stop:86803 length:1317 start_codon:yes stop_codon:yes gene_type:complete